MGKQLKQLTIVNSEIIKNKITISLITTSKTKRNRKNYTDKLAQSRAKYLAQKLNNPSRTMFYLKCAWNLTDEYLDTLLAISLKKNSPTHYFSAAAAREMRKNA